MATLSPLARPNASSALPKRLTLSWVCRQVKPLPSNTMLVPRGSRLAMLRSNSPCTITKNASWTLRAALSLRAHRHGLPYVALGDEPGDHSPRQHSLLQHVRQPRGFDTVAGTQGGCRPGVKVHLDTVHLLEQAGKTRIPHERQG